jgi:hypothetical protein
MSLIRHFQIGRDFWLGTVSKPAGAKLSPPARDRVRRREFPPSNFGQQPRQMFFNCACIRASSALISSM